MFRAYRDDLVGFAESLLRSREAAQEIVQDLFLRLWQMRDLWEPKGALNTYLFRATRNRAIMRLRRQRSELAFHDRLSNGERGSMSGSRDHASEQRSNRRRDANFGEDGRSTNDQGARIFASPLGGLARKRLTSQQNFR
jgi:RNA polymerase sigma-70 factor (ECF subfamily)